MLKKLKLYGDCVELRPAKCLFAQKISEKIFGTK